MSYLLLFNLQKEKQKEIKKGTTSTLKTVISNRLKQKQLTPLFGSSSKRSLDSIDKSFSDDHDESSRKKVARELQAALAENETLKKKLANSRAEALQYKELNKRLQDSLLIKIESQGLYMTLSLSLW